MGCGSSTEVTGDSQDSRLDFSIENEMDELSPLIRSSQCVPPYSITDVWPPDISETNMRDFTYPGPDNTILVRESEENNQKEGEKKEKDAGECEEKDSKDYLSPPSVASSLICLQSQQQRRNSLADQKFQSM